MSEVIATTRPPAWPVVLADLRVIYLRSRECLKPWAGATEAFKLVYDWSLNPLTGGFDVDEAHRRARDVLGVAGRDVLLAAHRGLFPKRWPH